MNEQRLTALRGAQAKRMAIAELRRGLRAREVDLRDLLTARDPRILHLTLVDVVRLCHAKPRHAHDGIRLMGAAALRNGVNLLVSVEQASQRSVDWVVAYVQAHPGVMGNRAGPR